ncbi:hypothetical protein PVAND_014086 [Polypedilum vanderplanki]|uniref:Uncharacterized protein n=1 Tax=Polypedilum vanderplanki TaxID=319348 RepID=A0A9J6CSK1_POLVA|nr:hypothetical protein PVAND_014086 [Polypedilum vanderplanki]
MHLTKNLISIALVTLLLAHIAAAQDTQKRNSLLAKRAGNKNIFQKSTTTTAEPAAYEDEEYVEGLEGDLEQQQHDDEDHSSTTTTTTEAPKKMIRPSVRPMRSNEDLLSALKKRRLNQKNDKAAVTQKPVQEEKQQFEPVEVKTPKPKPSIASNSNAGNRRFGGHKSANVKAPVQDNHAQNIEEPSSKTFKRSNRFSARTN